MTGETSSADFPTTADVFRPVFGGGSSDTFVTKLNATGSALVYSTYLGGSGRERSTDIAVDAAGNAYVGGGTESSDFPTSGDAFQPLFRGVEDAFVAKLNMTGSAIVSSSYLGGSSNDFGIAGAVDALGSAFVKGFSRSPNFPVMPGAFQTTSTGLPDAFVAKIADAVTPPSAVGRVTGGGTVPVGDRFGTFSLNVQRRRPNDVITGNLQYINQATRARVRATGFTSFSIAGNTATIGGTCTMDGAPCTFVVTVTDQGEPGRSDAFMIAVSSASAEGGTFRSGNIRIH